LSGLESGGINLQSVRHDEGKRIACLRKHTGAVSVLKLAPDEMSLLSGSWDKNVYDWDLNTGTVKRAFEGSGGQISTLEARPTSALPVPEMHDEVPVTNGTFSSNNAAPPGPNGTLSNGVKLEDGDLGDEDAPGSPTDSLFGGGEGGDSLFGDDDAGRDAPSGNVFGDDEDDEFSKAIANGVQQPVDADGDIDMSLGDGAPLTSQPVDEVPTTQTEGSSTQPSDATVTVKDDPSAGTGTAGLTNGSFPTAAAASSPPKAATPLSGPSSTSQSVSETTFLAASQDGTIRIWDRRVPNPVARIVPQRGTPPWCMQACWSPDGNYIYAGRRKHTVEEYSLHHGLGNVERTFKFPEGSGPVSSLMAMPNGRHLLW
jgi:transcriptional activator SPT8